MHRKVLAEIIWGLDQEWSIFYPSGVNHGFMPIVIVSLPTIQFHHYIMTKLHLN